jgi:hypothetical protein
MSIQQQRFHRPSNLLLLLFALTTSMVLRLLSTQQQQEQLFLVVVQAYPNGAGSCIGGVAPVGDYHLALTTPSGAKRTVLKGALIDGKVSVLIDSNAKNPLVEGTPYVLQTQTSYTITVVTTQDPGYKGILIRMSNTDDSIDVRNDVLLEPSDALLQDAKACNTETNTIGLTHVSNTEKLSVTANLNFDKPGTILLDISIVGVNDDKASLYGYTGYVLQIEGEAVTDAPTVAPTMAPVLPPGMTSSPSTSPTRNDFIVETSSPTYNTILRLPTSTTSTRTTSTSQNNNSNSSNAIFMKTSNAGTCLSLWSSIRTITTAMFLVALSSSIPLLLLL